MSPTVRTPSRSRRASVAGPTPHSARAGSGWRNASSSPGATTCTPVAGTGPSVDARGLAASDASLASNFGGGHPDRAGEPLPRQDLGPDAARPTVGPVALRAPGTGDVEERLVEAERLHQRGERAEDGPSPARSPRRSGRGRRAGTPRGGTAAGPGRWAWPRRRRRPGPRSWPRPPRPGSPCRPPPPAGPAARAGAAARPTRRRRPCRRAGSSWPPAMPPIRPRTRRAWGAAAGRPSPPADTWPSGDRRRRRR